MSRRLLLKHILKLADIMDIEELKSEIPKSITKVAGAKMTWFGGIVPMVSTYTFHIEDDFDIDHEQILTHISSCVGYHQSIGTKYARVDRLDSTIVMPVYIIFDPHYTFYFYVCSDNGLKWIKKVHKYFVPIITQLIKRNATVNMLSIVNHQIKNPLQGLLGLATLLNDSGLTKVQKDYVQQLRQCNLELMRVANDVSDYEHLSKCVDMQTASVDMSVSNCCRQVFLSTRSKLKKNGNALEYDIHRKCPMILNGDRDKITQFLINYIIFINNCVPDSKMVMTVRHDKDHLQIKVTITSTNGMSFNNKFFPKIRHIMTNTPTLQTALYVTESFSDAIAFKLLNVLGGTIKVGLKGPQKDIVVDIQVPIQGPKKQYSVYDRINLIEFGKPKIAVYSAKASASRKCIIECFRKMQLEYDVYESVYDVPEPVDVVIVDYDVHKAPSSLQNYLLVKKCAIVYVSKTMKRTVPYKLARPKERRLLGVLLRVCCSKSKYILPSQVLV